MTDLARLVETSTAVASTRSRRSKIGHIADYLGSLDAQVVGPAVAFLSGVVPQGALGVGWATLAERPPPAPTSSLGLADVVDVFDELLSASGPGSGTRRKQLTSGLMAAATESEQRFLVGLITGEIRQGALEGIMVEAVAAAAGIEAGTVRRAVMFNGRIWEVAAVAMVGGSEALAEIGLVLFRPVKPMLAQTAGDVVEAWGRTGPAAVEWKLDGIRIQVHRAGDLVEVYTRNLNRVTERMSDLAAVVHALPCEAAVLDGEALFLDDGGRPARFQDTAGRFGTDDLPDRGIRPFFFDLLHLDGEDLIDSSLLDRRRRLERLAPEAVVPHRVADSPPEAQVMLDEAIAAGHEGVVIKAVDSTYEAGRRGSDWVKVKPVHTLDLVVLAAEWGHGRRQGWLSNLHLGALGPDGPVMVGKTFKGLTDELLTWQTHRLQEIESERAPGVVYVRPELVVEVAMDGVQVSTRYPGGVALRFARVRGYRPDKDPGEADTIDAVRALGGLPPLEA